MWTKDSDPSILNKTQQNQFYLFSKGQSESARRKAVDCTSARDPNSWSIQMWSANECWYVRPACNSNKLSSFYAWKMHWKRHWFCIWDTLMNWNCSLRDLSLEPIKNPVNCKGPPPKELCLEGAVRAVSTVDWEAQTTKQAIFLCSQSFRVKTGLIPSYTCFKYAMPTHQ